MPFDEYPVRCALFQSRRRFRSLGLAAVSYSGISLVAQANAVGDARRSGTEDICVSIWPDAVRNLAKSGVIALPAGTFRADCRLVVRDQPVHVMGAGVGLTRILFGKGERAGLEIDEDSPTSGVEVSGLSLVAPDPTSVPAITVHFERFASTQHGPSIHDVDIRSGNGTSTWREGVVLENGAYGTLRDVSVSGTSPRTKSGVDPRTGLGSCFRLTAGSIGVEVDHATCYYAVTGLKVEDDSEGVKVHDSEFVAVTIGLEAVGRQNKNHASPPSIIFSRNHINSYVAGARFTAWSQVQATSNLLYKMIDSDQDWTGFWLADARIGTDTLGSNLGNYTSNIFYGFRGSAAGGTAQAYKIAPSATNNFVHGEIAEAMDYFADEENGSGPNRITDNTAPDLGHAWFRNINPNILCYGNTPNRN